MKKRTTALMISGALIAGAMGQSALATGLNQTISALLNREITITYNGEVQSFTDANGNAVYPISYNGTTYLPVRAVSGLLDVDVNWDSASNTVMLGTVEKQPVDLVSCSNSGGTEFSWIITDKDQLQFAGSDAIQQFNNGIVWHQWNGSLSYFNGSTISFDVNGYSQIAFTAAADVEAKVSLYDENNKVFSSFVLKEGDIVSKTINLNGATKISFASDSPLTGLDAVYGKVDGYLYIYDAELS